MFRTTLSALVLVAAAATAVAQEAPSSADYVATFHLDAYGDVIRMIGCEARGCGVVDLEGVKVEVDPALGEIRLTTDDGATEKWENCRENEEEQISECDWVDDCEGYCPTPVRWITAWF